MEEKTDEEAYADFAKRYSNAGSDYQLACVLSGRLRDLDKRTKAANRRADACAPLLSAAEAFIKEAESMGWGERSETALPGAYDLLRKAVKEAKG